jgi:hypothetical protein
MFWATAAMKNVSQSGREAACRHFPADERSIGKCARRFRTAQTRKRAHNGQMGPASLIPGPKSVGGESQQNSSRSARIWYANGVMPRAAFPRVYRAKNLHSFARRSERIDSFTLTCRRRDPWHRRCRARRCGHQPRWRELGCRQTWLRCSPRNWAGYCLRWCTSWSWQ